MRKPSEREYLVALYAYLSFGPARIKLLRDYFRSAEKVWGLSRAELLKVGLSQKIVSGFVNHRNKFSFSEYFNRLKILKIDYITIDDNNYPNNLIDLTNAPVVLYIKGNINANDDNAVAIVGSRRMTTYGREVTEKFSTELASLGVTIVSGLALGIDAAAHRAALSVNGRCIAVLASGLDTVSPVTNRWIADEIIKRNEGAIISEYPLGFPPMRGNFANRNRIISGLAKAVLVVEGKRKSGTILTANAAAEQGRQVFAVPGEITSPMSEAPYFLIENGAKMAVKTKDILDDLDMQLMVDKDSIGKVLPSSKEEEKLLNILNSQPMHVDEIARESKMGVNDVSAKLTMMELKGLVRNMSGGIYKKT